MDRKLGAWALVVLVGCLVGCGSEYVPGPPEGWTEETVDGTTRWWQAGADTSMMYRDLETLQTMDILSGEPVYVTDRQFARRGSAVRGEFSNAVKRSLVRLYRNKPEVVDSLFEAYVEPKIAEADLSGDLKEEVERLQREGYETIRKHFREARTLLELGTDVPVIYPDSLRDDYSGDVLVQAYVDEEGVPQALELIEGIHPVLDEIALRATTQMRWQPAYLLQKNDWQPIPSWSRFRVRFNTQSNR